MGGMATGQILDSIPVVELGGARAAGHGALHLLGLLRRHGLVEAFPPLSRFRPALHLPYRVPGFRFQVSVFAVEILGLGVWGFQDLVSRAWGLFFRVWGSGFRVWNLGGLGTDDVSLPASMLEADKSMCAALELYAPREEETDASGAASM